MGDNSLRVPRQSGFQSPDGTLHVLTATGYEPHPHGVPVFNFEVDDYHSYFVSAHGTRGPPLLVHNADYGSHVELALGFSDNLPQFKKQFPDARDFADLDLNPYDPAFSQHLRTAMERADVIRFDASGMRMLTGPDGVLTGPPHLDIVGSTNWELRTILDNDALKTKTKIYVNGLLKSFEDLLNMP